MAKKQTFFHAVIAVTGALALTIGLPRPAQASPMLTMNLEGGLVSGAAIGPGIYGTVTATQASTTEIDVEATLLAGYKFVQTGGPHTTFAFNLDIAPANYSVNLTSSGFTYLGATSSDTPYGTYSDGITCSSCGSGGSNPNAGPIDFSITDPNGIGLSDFIGNGSTPLQGYVFAADIINTATGSTGAVASPVPEPGSLILFATGLLGFGLVRRRRAS